MVLGTPVQNGVGMSLLVFGVGSISWQEHVVKQTIYHKSESKDREETVKAVAPET